MLNIKVNIWSKKWGYQFRRRMRHPWVPRREGGGGIPSPSDWGLGEHRELSQWCPGQIPGSKQFYFNLISAAGDIKFFTFSS